MNYSEEFKKFATQHRGVSSTYYDKIISSMTPYIMEERQLNVTQMDVFSRLMMDRIIFLGTDVNSHVANIIQAQLLFLESLDASKDIQIYINSPGGEVYSMTLCSSSSQRWLPSVQGWPLLWQQYCSVLEPKESVLRFLTPV